MRNYFQLGVNRTILIIFSDFVMIEIQIEQQRRVLIFVETPLHACKKKSNQIRINIDSMSKSKYSL